MKSRFAYRVIPILVSSLVLAALLLAAVPVASAFAGDCDGTTGDDNITCSADPTTPDGIVNLHLGDDSYVQDAGVTADHVLGDGLEDGSFATGNGGDDHITINGTVNGYVEGDDVTGHGGNDTIIVNGTVGITVFGDYIIGDGGNDSIIVNGTVGENVIGDTAVGGDGGDDTIIVNGTVGGFVRGDSVDGDGGDDIIIINGEVVGDVYGDNGTYVSGSADGNDTVVLGVNAVVGGTIDGQGGTDTLSFDTLTQSQVNALGLNPAGDTATINGNTYTWLNFEQLLGLLEELIERGLRVFFAGSSAAAVETPEGDGMRIFAGPGRIASISYASLSSLGVGESATYSTPNSAGWYVTVANLGVDPDHAGKTLYQVSICSPGGGSAGQFTFSI